MNISNGSIDLSASDLVGFLNCRHLSGLDRAVAEGRLPRPQIWRDPLLEALWERGSVHELSFVQHLASRGKGIVRIDGIEVTELAVAETLAAMRDGADAIVQA